MQFVSDPPIATKIAKMQQRIRWQHPAIAERGIDQTELVIDDRGTADQEFSFLVIGDSGSGSHRGHHPQRKVAEMMLEFGSDARFVLHTGDVIYLVGSQEYYFKNFIDPYREFLVGGEQAKRIKFDQMRFNRPFLLVPGNHDYYDLPLLYGILAQTALPFRYLLRSRVDLDVGWRGSQQGKAYAMAFMDYLLGLDDAALAKHLDQHYTATGSQGRCLRYQPKEFTRLPNRYYQFRYGGIDFFALDSNTFNSPLPLAEDEAGNQRRQQLEQRRADVQKEQQELMQRSLLLNPTDPDQAEQLDDCRTKLEQLGEIEKDIDKQLTVNSGTTVDTEQLEWLKQRLIESWYCQDVRGRVIFFHHPPYVTEATKWYQGQTIAVRVRLRTVFDQVVAAVDPKLRVEQSGNDTNLRPIVDLVLNGHAHCLEHLKTGETGYGDANIPWIVCGGSGYSLRRQRQEGTEILEIDAGGKSHAVAESKLYVGRSGQGSYKRRPYSFIRIDAKDGNPPRFVVRPYVAERYQHQWYERSLPEFKL